MFLKQLQCWQKKKLSKKKIIGGECSTPGIISLIGCYNNDSAKKELGINRNSNILLIGCEGDTDPYIYKKLLKIGEKKIF